jgi:methionyl-tRNA formyltransferase
VFFGTPQWAVPSLRRLIDSEVDVVAVVTNPDKPAGRGMRLKASPVKELAEAAGIEVLQPPRARDAQLYETLHAAALDVAAVVAYGKILPVDLLDIPRRGFVNLHFSLLPEYRGPAPVQRAIMDGRTATGVSTMVLTEGMDEGPVLERRREAIGRHDTAATLGDRLSRTGAGVLLHSLVAYCEGSLRPQPQDHSAATYAPKVTSEETRIDWTAPHEHIRNRIRALDPAPGAWTTLRGKRLKVWRGEPQEHAGPLPPGLLDAREELVAGTGVAPLELEEVQMEGGRRMSGAELARGLRLVGGERFQ